MKRLIYIIILSLISFVGFGQDNSYSTIDEKSGDWNEETSWTNGLIAGSFANETTTLNQKDSYTEIRGKIKHTGNIAISGSNANLIINSGDTLFIYGNLSVGGGGQLLVESNAVLLVIGNMEVEGNSVNNNNGIIVVANDLKVSGSTSFNNNSAIYTESTSGNQTISGQAPQPLSDLEEQHPDLWNMIITVQPIKLLSFTGISQNNAVLLDWTTAWEENFDFFTVERAGPDLKFQAIGTVEGNGNTTAEVAYDFTDQTPLQGQAFYRLKATDYDGSIEYHKIISVFFNGYSSSTTKVYPNPVVSHNLKIETTEDKMHNVKLLDMSGRSVYTQTIQLGTNEISLPQMIKPGAYMLVLSGDHGKQHQQRIMVL